MLVSHEMGLCSQCHDCIDSCPGKALNIVEGVMTYSQDNCTFCESCMMVCDSQAIKVKV